VPVYRASQDRKVTRVLCAHNVYLVLKVRKVMRAGRVSQGSKVNEGRLGTKVVLVRRVKMVYLDCLAGLVLRVCQGCVVLMVLKVLGATDLLLTKYQDDQVLKVTLAVRDWMDCLHLLVNQDHKDLSELPDFLDLLAARATVASLDMMVAREWQDYQGRQDRKVTQDLVVLVRKVKWGPQVRQVSLD
jgi:hypothetical protein